MTPLDITTCYGIAMSASAIFCGMRWLRAERQAVRLADNNAYWQLRARSLGLHLATIRAQASQRGRHARACQLDQVRSKVWTKVAELRAEMAE